MSQSGSPMTIVKRDTSGSRRIGRKHTFELFCSRRIILVLIRMVLQRGFPIRLANIILRRVGLDAERIVEFRLRDHDGCWRVMPMRSRLVFRMSDIECRTRMVGVLPNDCVNVCLSRHSQSHSRWYVGLCTVQSAHIRAEPCMREACESTVSSTPGYGAMEYVRYLGQRLLTNDVEYSTNEEEEEERGGLIVL